jgi:hypothetical protein
MWATTTEEAKTSTNESRPNATSASDRAARPAAMATTTSKRFHATVAYSSRMTVRPASSRSEGPRSSGGSSWAAAAVMAVLLRRRR